jgi:hypothetical protein
MVSISPVMQQVLITMFSYLAVFILAFLVMSVLQRGFFWNWLKARTSGGKKVLIKIMTVTRPIYKVGWISEGDLIFKGDKAPDGKKMEMRINNIPRDAIYKDLGVFFVEVDGQKWIVHKPDGTSVTASDPEKMNSLYLRALYRPSILDQKTQIMILILIFVLLFSLINLVLGGMNMSKINALTANVGTIKSFLVTNVSQIGNTGVLR